MEPNLSPRNIDPPMPPVFFDVSCSKENSKLAPSILITGRPGAGKNFNSITKNIESNTFPSEENNA